MENDNLSGQWVGLFIGKEDKTIIDFTENIVRKKPVLKILLKLYLKKQQKLYLRHFKKIQEERMKSQEIIRELKKLSSDKYKANVVRMEMPEDNSLGVSIANLRKFVKNIKKSNSLAY